MELWEQTELVSTLAANENDIRSEIVEEGHFQNSQWVLFEDEEEREDPKVPLVKPSRNVFWVHVNN